jgi:hypothetical protein
MRSHCPIGKSRVEWRIILVLGVEDCKTLVTSSHEGSRDFFEDSCILVYSFFKKEIKDSRLKEIKAVGMTAREVSIEDKQVHLKISERIRKKEANPKR